MDRQVAHGGVREVEFERLPVIAVVERNEDRAFCASKQQSLSLGVFAYNVARGAVGNASADLRPSFPRIAGAVNMRAQIIQPERIDRRVGRARIEMRSFN